MQIVRETHVNKPTIAEYALAAMRGEEPVARAAVKREKTIKRKKLTEAPVIADAICYRSGPGWHVAQINGPERDIHIRVHQAGFEGWIPVERVNPSKARPHLDRLRPFIPGYIFVMFDPNIDAWSSLLDVKGVVGLLKNNDLPLRVPTAWVEALRYAEHVGELDRTKIDPDGFRVGDRVLISEGPFSGHHALIQGFMAKLKSTTARKRARVLIDFLGRMSEIELPVVSLERL